MLIKSPEGGFFYV